MDAADHWHGLAYNNLVCEIVELLITCCRRGRRTLMTDDTMAMTIRRVQTKGR
nr:hypothetical protein I308_06190 [Cryptococcus tetragattii IND107]